MDQFCFCVLKVCVLCGVLHLVSVVAEILKDD